MKTTVDISKMSDESVIDLFTEAFEEQVAMFNDIGEFEATIQRSMGDQDVKMEVLIVGLAGSPTVDDWRESKLESADEVKATNYNGDLFFERVPDEVTILNTNDYTVLYKMV